MSKVIQIRRLIVHTDRGVEPPSENPAMVCAPLHVFERFPRSPGREPKNTPFEMTYDQSTGIIEVRHPKSGERVHIPREHCSWVPFSPADEARVLAELEKATAPEVKAKAAQA